MPSGAARGDLFLRPVRVTADDGPQTTDDRQTSSLDQTSASLDIRPLALAMRDATTLDGRFAWYTDRPLGARHQFSWRLQDAAGGVLAQLDAQPGYGYQPSTLWPAGRWTADWLALRLPAAPAEGEYPLVMRLYDAAGQVLMRRVGLLTWADGAWQPRPHEPGFALPEGLSPAAATFGRAGDPPGEASIALRGYQLAQEGAALRLTLYWEALRDAPDEYTRFVHLIDAAGAIAAQVDSAPAGDSYPTGQWVEGEVVADTVTFDLSAVPVGEYRLGVGFYQPVEGLAQVSALGPDGPLPDGRALLPDTVIVRP
jgi:hypothetical protein